MNSIGKIRYVVGSAFMFGVAPEYFAIWAVWRGVTMFAPNWVYQWGDDKLYHMYQSLVLFFFETCTKVDVILYGETENILKKKENVLYLGNHQSTADWMVANMVAVRGSSLGHLRYVMKDVLQFIPLYGYYFYAHGCIYVKRGKFNQQKMIDSLNYLRDKSFNTWLVVFPEGTRYYPSTPKTIAKSEQYAKDNHLQVLKHHLVPKVRGTWLALEKLHSKFDAIYDITVLYENSVGEDGKRKDAPQLAAFLLGKCPTLHIHIRRIPMHDVPTEEEALKTWMHNLFVEKDRFVEPFFSGKDGKIFSDDKLKGRVSRLSFWSTFSSFLFFGLVSLPLAFTEFGQRTYGQIVLYGTLGSYGWLALRSVC